MRAMVALGLIALVGCTAKRTADGIDVDPITDVVGNWSANLQARNSSSVGGTATVRSAAAGSAITVHITGGVVGSQHPWHVHRGTCSTSGAIVGGAGNYPALQVGQDRTAHASTNVSVGLNEDDKYHVNIHRSPSDIGTIIGCGDLKK